MEDQPSTIEWNSKPECPISKGGRHADVRIRCGRNHAPGNAPLDAGQPAVPVGSEFQVNTYTTGYQFSSSVAADADGDFVVVWSSYGSSGNDTYYYTIDSKMMGHYVCHQLFQSVPPAEDDGTGIDLL